jgi:hypothetical protein
LRIAEHYLRLAFPNAKIAWQGGTAVQSADRADIDFLLVESRQIDSLRNVGIDLVVNTWSFGEMPDSEIGRLFRFIQHDARVDYVFLLNHILVPVALPAQLDFYNWITALGPHWRILRFEIDPPIHRNPELRSHQIGAMILARRIDDDDALVGLRREAASAAALIQAQQWIAGSLAKNRPTGHDAAARRSSLLSSPSRQVNDQSEFVLDQFSRTVTIWRPDLDGGTDGTFFRLWNDARLNRSPLSVRLLRIWLHLQWRPVLRSGDGPPQDVLFREEISYAKFLTGRLEPDPALKIPDWMARELFRSAV